MLYLCLWQAQSHSHATQSAMWLCCSADPHAAQVGAAVMRKMALQGRSQEQAAEDFATALFNQWGPGLAACRNGAILLLSIEDRQVTTLPGALASCGAC